MVDLDLKDRKILYELDLNARQSFDDIGKKVGLSKDSVAYRVKRMEDEGVIKYYWTAINTFRLGYNVFRIYINFQLLRSDIKNEIIKYFVDYKNSWAVISIKGEIDLAVIVWVKDVYEFYQFWEKTLERYGDYFDSSIISMLVYANAYEKSFLLPDIKKSDRLLYQTRCGGEPVEIDEIDYNLLNELAVNARVSFVELSKKLGCSSQTINYKINNLIKNGVIQAFRVYIDIYKLGLGKFVINIYLKDKKQKKLLINYLKDIPNLEYIDISLGWADIQLELVLENTYRLNSILDDVFTKFPNAIKKQTLMLSENYHKERWLPEIY
ncbi:MAG: winged helix-turn-helix transcriptional regulator [Candidatus Thermoplasmatota archaeon]